MEKGNPGNMNRGAIKQFNPEKHGMALCPVCKGTGYVQNPTRQCCPKCGGFGYIKKEGDRSVFLPPSDDLEKK
jgi:DnaJ-class molecular chaperone